ncbi:MAG: hypothetical protein IT562_10810 [Alphaproteobacteria bacterium]|nr:hypothetical protein [Alphaproteobacteria bacterium]
MTVDEERAAARSAVEALPEVIRVGGFDIRIERWHSLVAAASQSWGEFSSMEMRISIQVDMPTRFKAVDTTMHEIMHAVFWVYGIKDSDDEERTVAAMGSAWMALHRDNPWLAGWLTKTLAT